MTQGFCQILLIENQLDKIELLQKVLSQAQHSSLAQGLTFSVTCVKSLAQGMDTLRDPARQFDVILLNLSLPDSQGIDTLIKLREKWSNIPIIVQTDQENETLIVESFQLGADGYLQIQTLDSNLLIYEIRLAIERQQYRGNLALQQQQQQQAKEFAELESLGNVSNRTGITARMFGSESLQESLPELFQEFCQLYGDLLELALEQRAFKVEHNLSDQLRALADKLGFVKASPRDIIEIHTKILKEKNREVPLAKAQAYTSEGRLIILQLMGYLASFYRKYYIGLSNINLSSHRNFPRNHE